ncbi:hypothetical protein DL767_006845 [Monosporascus sp. MG133]|nr:hypothetical protein DL767_006845 [Monosporascus sp. MG133]
MTVQTGDAPAPALCHIVTPIGMLGYGVDVKQVDAALEKFTATGEPTALILDSGSTDSGPQKLALGGMTVPRGAYVRDLQKLVASARKFNVPLLLSSAGGSGTNYNTREIVKIIDEVAHKNPTGKFKVVALYADIDKEFARERLHAGVVTPCSSAPPLTEADIDQSVVIVAQMGPEPILDTLIANPDAQAFVIGRAYDASQFCAFAEYCYQKLNLGEQLDKYTRRGTFTHVGEILECGGLCAEPKGGGVIATIRLDGSFEITPMAPNATCTPVSVAAHTLYENTRPDTLFGPGGHIDLSNSQYELLEDKRTVRVRGSRYVYTKETKGIYQIKLEAAKLAGYRAMYLGAHKDPVLIGQMEKFLATVKGYVKMEHADVTEPWELEWHIIGKGDNGNIPQEVALIGEALAPTQELATSIVAKAKVATIHAPYRGLKATSGNFAHGIGGLYTVPLGPCAEFCIYHLVELKEGEERGGIDAPLFRFETFEVGEEPTGTNGTAEAAAAEEPAPEVDDEKKKKIAAMKKQARVLNADPLTSLSDAPTLGELATVIRSKNSGPYEITFDVMFDRESIYQAVKNSDILNTEAVARLFGIPMEHVIYSGFFDQALAYKVTTARLRNGKRVPAGGYMEDDVHGSQMYLPLLRQKLPEGLKNEIQKILDRTISVQ